MRLLLGNTRLDSPRGQLRAKAFLHAERLAGRVFEPLLSDETDPLKAAHLGLAIVREVQPQEEATLEVTADWSDLTSEQIDERLRGMSLAELRALYASSGGDPEALSAPDPS